MRRAPGAFGIARPRWRLEDLRGALPWLNGYSLSGVGRALARLGVSRRRGRFSLRSPDPEYREKLALVEGALEAARGGPGRTSVVYADEFTLFRQPTLGPAYAARGEGPKASLSHRANTRQRLSGAMDAATGRVVWTAASKMGVRGLRRFLEALRAAYPARELYLVWDNWPTHRHPEVLSRAEQLGIEILWLPTYAPWTNPIEKLRRWLRQEAVHHHRLSDRWEELKGRVAAFLGRFSEGSRELLRYVGLLPD